MKWEPCWKQQVKHNRSVRENAKKKKDEMNSVRKTEKQNVMKAIGVIHEICDRSNRLMK